MNDDICMGLNCKVKMTCLKHLRWLAAEDDEVDDIMGCFGEKCSKYEQKEYYGG